MELERRGFLAGAIAAVLAPLAALLPKRSKPLAMVAAKVMYPGACMVKITGRCKGRGKYEGVLWMPDAEGKSVRIVNVAEIGKQGHALTASDEYQTVFPAVFLKTAEDVPVYAISGLQVADCA